MPDSITKDRHSAKDVIYVLGSIIRKNEKTTTESFYPSSAELSAAEMAVSIGNHWRIENQLQYVKDVVTHEDAVKIKQYNTARALAIIKN